MLRVARVIEPEQTVEIFGSLMAIQRGVRRRTMANGMLYKVHESTLFGITTFINPIPCLFHLQCDRTHLMGWPRRCLNVMRYESVDRRQSSTVSKLKEPEEVDRKCSTIVRLAELL